MGINAELQGRQVRITTRQMEKEFGETSNGGVLFCWHVAGVGTFGGAEELNGDAREWGA